MSLPTRRHTRRTGSLSDPIQLEPVKPKSRRVRCHVCNELCAKEEMIACSVCRRWSHSQCCDFGEDNLRSIESYQCQDCRAPAKAIPTLLPITQRSSIKKRLTRLMTSDTTTVYASAIESSSSSSSETDNPKSSKEPDISVTRRSTGLSQASSSSRIRVAATLELQRIEDEKTLIQERRKQKQQIQQRIMDELINQQKEIEMQLEEDKVYLAKRCEQQVLLENCPSSVSRTSSIGSSNIIKRTLDWVNEGNRQIQHQKKNLPKRFDETFTKSSVDVPLHSSLKDFKEFQLPKVSSNFKPIANELQMPNTSSNMFQNENEFQVPKLSTKKEDDIYLQKTTKIEPIVKMGSQIPIVPTYATGIGSAQIPNMSTYATGIGSAQIPIMSTYATGIGSAQIPIMSTYATGIGSAQIPKVSTYVPNIRSATGTIPKLTRDQLASRQSLPKDLPIFNGDPRTWVSFIETYESTTQLCRYTNAENKIRLRKCLQGRALRMVESSLLLPATIPAAIEILRNTFGKPEDLVDIYLEKIRNMETVKSDSIPLLIEYSVEVQNLCATLEAAKLYDYLNNSLLLRELTEKLPANLKINWALYRETVPKANLSKFGEWMSAMAKAVTKITPVFTSMANPKSTNNSKSKAKNQVNMHEVVTRSNEKSASISQNPESSQYESGQPESSQLKFSQIQNKSKFACENCNRDGHRIQNCQHFRKLNYSERWDVVQKNRLCRKCLENHHVSRCKSKEICAVNGCEYKHHKLLHKPNSTVIEKSNQNSSTAQENRNNFHHYELNALLYRIVPIVIYYQGRSLYTYALLDEGSSISILDHKIAEELTMTGTKENLCLKWTANTVRMEKDSVKISFEISGRHHGAMKYFVNARTVKQLDLPSQSITLDLLSKYRHLKNLPIKPYMNVKPMMLIGLDNYRLTVPRTIIEGGEKDPIATQCRLGWTIGGGEIISGKSVQINCHICECSDDKLHDLVKEFFSMEYMGVRYSEPLLSVDVERSLKILETTTIRKGNQYETGLLWKYDKVKLPDNFPMALRRLDCLNKQMAKDKKLHDEMMRQLSHYVKSGYARKLTEKEILDKSDRIWYLPIFGVTYPKKPGKVRMVFDAAAKFNGISLNSVLLSGPDQLTSLPDVLRRFREGKIALSGDIREMFHQVAIRTEDQNSQRFLFGDVKNPEYFTMQVMTFGATCSPAAAQYVKNKNANEYKTKFPRAVNAIIANHYVDDLLDSVDNISDAIQLGKDVRYIHQQANFEIRNWLSNSTEVLKALGEPNSAIEKSIIIHSELAEERVLGMWWNTLTDTFTYSLKYTKLDEHLLSEKRKPTKREVLRILMSIFDPLGLLSNFLIFIKILLQDIWRSKIGWDEEITDEHFERWRVWIKLLPSVETIRITRHYVLGCQKSGTSAQLHIFVDASQDAYATVAYFRFETEHGVEIALVGAKSKVAPLKLMSIPRLELQGGLLGARFSRSIQQAHTIEIYKTFFWTDSSTVLSWLNSDVRDYSRFVGFRVTEILDLTKVSDWRWISGKQNVADEATKWKKNPSFESSSRWFSGPDFLRQPESEWPEKKSTEKTTEELRYHLLIHHEMKVPFQYSTKDFSCYIRLRRAQALALRYCFNLIAKVRGLKRVSGPLTQFEYKRAEDTLFRKAQSEIYAPEMSILKHNRKLPVSEHIAMDSSSSLYKESPYLDENGVIRMRGRIDLAKNIPETMKRPVLLPRYHHITHLLVDNYHRRYHHHNHQTVLNEIKQKYVIPRLRVVLKQVVKRCQKCKNNRAVPHIPEMADLPESRLQSFVRPFSFVGLDYFGPIYVIVKRSEEKRWILLVTCLTMRAIHLEIAHSMTTDSFIMCFENFCFRRGYPLEIRSDQGSNLKGADNELRKALQEIDWNKIEDKFTSPDMKWLFNPPASPHMGGIFERMVRSVKDTLHRIIPVDRKPNDEVLKNVITGVENIVNSRPLTYVPLESTSDEALTPNHFLIGSSSGYKPKGVFTEDDLILRKNWRKSQYLLDVFWKRWIHEYLPTITRRTKWFENVKNVEVGDVVIIVDENSTRNCWPKGMVLAVHTDKTHGRVRSATVQTSSTQIDKKGNVHTKFSIYDRPVAKLAVLDVKPEKEVSCPKDTILGGSVTDNPAIAH